MHNEKSFELDVSLAWNKLSRNKPDFYEDNYFGTIRYIEGEPSLSKGDKEYYRKPNVQKSYGIQYAWLIYQKAAASSLNSLILGTVKIRSDNLALKNFGMTSVDPHRKTQKRMEALRDQGVDVASEHHGSILADKNWWPLFNDAWLLGGVHKLSPFYLARSSFPDKALVWSSEKNRPRVLGRELIGLKTFGYERIKHEHEKGLGYVFCPVDRSKALTATFSGLCDAVDACQSASEILDILKLDTMDYAEYEIFPSAPKGPVVKLNQPYTAYEEAHLESIHFRYEVDGLIELTGKKKNRYLQARMVEGKVRRIALGSTTMFIDPKNVYFYIDESYVMASK